jgi:hypothetical protein
MPTLAGTSTAAAQATSQSREREPSERVEGVMFDMTLSVARALGCDFFVALAT